MCSATHNKKFGLGFKYPNEGRRCMVFIIDDIMFLALMFIKYTVFDIDIIYTVIFPYPGLFIYGVNVQQFPCNLISDTLPWFIFLSCIMSLSYHI